ncbi:unnamed protein product [Ectocarpus sp. CCAP 1310/34]|nr:unnamed protein product [Ectocarpus sp. CCAP 1310/34]
MVGGGRRAMADVERPTRRRGKMGGAGRALALGLTIGGWASSQGLTAAASDLPAAAAAGSQECGFIVTMWGESAACEQQLDGAAVGCDKKSFSRRADRVQALVGSVRKEAGLGPVREAGSPVWRQVLDFGCVDGRDKLVVTLYDNLMRPLATCEVGETASIESSKAMGCEGAHGMHFKYAVEHTALLAEPIRPQRRAQSVTSTATPTPAAVVTTPAPVSSETEPTPAAVDPTAATLEATAAPVEPTAAAVGPTLAPEMPATEAPEPEPTEPPTAEATSAPVTPATAEPTPRPTSAQTTPDTPAPVAPERAEPTPRPTPSPVTPATPAPITESPVTPGTPEPTPAPVAAVVPETPAPVTLTPPTDAPQAPVAAPSLEPTVGTTDSPVAAPTPPPSTLPTSTPQAPPTAPPESPAPTALIGTDEPTLAPRVTARVTETPVVTEEPAVIEGPAGAVTASPVASPPPVDFLSSSPSTPPAAVPPSSASDPPTGLAAPPTERPTPRPTPSPVSTPEPPTDSPVLPPFPVPSTPRPTTSPPTAVTPMPVAPTSPVSSTEPPTDSPNAPPSTTSPSTPQPSAARPNAAAFTPMPVASPPPVVPAATTLQPTAAAATTTSPMNPLPREAPSSSPTRSPSSPSAATPSAETTAPPSPVVSTETVAPGAGAAVTTPAPAAGATVTPATPAPSAAAGEAPAPFSSPAPVATPSSPAEATLSPNTEEVCTTACVEDNVTVSYFSATYYDARCEGKDDSDLSGCNLSSANSEWNNCRYCIIDLESFEAENGEGSVDWPLCPCCVAETLGMDPQTDECIAEAGTAVTTPAPTMFGQTTLELTTEANDPDLLMMSFNSDDCTAFGIAVIPGTPPKVMEVAGYTDANGLCNSNFDKLVGTECELESYSWDYSDSSFEYMYTCSTSTSAGRRRLADGGSEAYPFESDAVLCNNGAHFVSLSSFDGGETGLVYATPDAENYDSVTNSQTALSGSDMCGASTDANVVTTMLLEQIEEEGLSGLLEEADESSSEGDGLGYEIIIGIVCVVVLLMGCACFCCYRHRKGKESRGVHMRRNLGFTPDMEAKGEGNFGPTNKHVAITRGGGPQVTPEMLATTSYSQPSHPPTHQRAPSEAPSSIIEDNIANNYRPKTAAKSWKERKAHKDLTKPVPQQHVIGGSPNSEELKAEDSREGSHANSNTRSQASARSEQLSEHSLSQLQMANQTAAAQPNYGYTFEHVEEGEEDDDDDDARSAATGMSGPSKYAPSGYAPSNHQDGVTHDLMSQYEPSVYEADSQYDPSLYGRESEYGDESSSYSYNDGAGSRRGGYAGGGGGRGGRHVSGRASVADTAAMSHLGSVMEMDDGGSAYAPSESYVSSYVSSEDDDGRPARSIHPRGGPNDAQAMGGVPTDGGSSSNGGGSGGGYSRHNAHRSGRQPVASGRSGFGASSAGSSSRHSGARSGFEGGSRSYDDEDDESAVGRTAVSMDDLEYYSEDHNAGGMTSGRGAPLTDLEETHGGQRW